MVRSAQRAYRMDDQRMTTLQLITPLAEQLQTRRLQDALSMRNLGLWRL